MLNVKKDFPIFENNPDLVYLDTTATSLKPKVVLERLLDYYQNFSANVFRGIYKISEKATAAFEHTRQSTASFINADQDEIVFTRNTTESINLVCYALGRKLIGKGDEIVVSIAEHHSNFVPWQQLAFENEAVFKVLPVDEQGILIQDWEKVISKKTKILALTYVSNVLGTINPVKEIISRVRKIKKDIIILIDAAQAVSSIRIDVKDLDCDFLAFSSHKMLGPTGVGVLYGKKDLLEEAFPFLYGGEMISKVEIEQSIFQPPPHKFEAGTPAIGEVIAFSAAIEYLENLGLDKIKKYLADLGGSVFSALKDEFGENIRILGPADMSQRTSIFSFSFYNYHPHDIAQILDEQNIAVRAGHHCAMPLHKFYRLGASVRASFYIYNDENDLQALVKGLAKVRKILS